MNRTSRIASALWAGIAIAIVVAAGLGVNALHARATGHHDALLSLAETDAQSREARLLGWMLIEGRAPAGGEVRQREIIDALRGDASGGDAEVAAALTLYVGALSDETTAIVSGDVAGARAIALERREPAFGVLEHAANSKAASHVRALDRADDVAAAGSAATLTLAALAVGSLAWRYTRARAAAEQAALRQSEARFRNLINDASDIIGVIDQELRAMYLSPAAARMLGYTAVHLLGSGIAELFHERDRSRVASRLRALAVSPNQRISLEAQLSCRDGTLRHAEVIASNLLDDESIAGIVLNIRDITDRKELEERLRRRALHDALTGLPNREHFIEEVEASLGEASVGGERVAVLFMDLDQFKSVNDTLGHNAGDELLIAVARRLQTCVDGEDLVARLSGDEFAVLLRRVRRQAEAAEVAQQILDVLRAPVAASGELVHTGASIGIAFDDDEIESVGALLRRADSAMYRAKRRGGAQFMVYGADADNGRSAWIVDPDELREAS